MEGFGQLSLGTGGASWIQGYNGQLAFASSDVVCFEAAGAVVQLNVTTGSSGRLPTYSSQTVHRVACCATAGRIAYTESGQCPKVFVTTFPATAADVVVLEREERDLLSYQAVAFSADGEYLVTIDAAPHSQLIVWNCGDGSIVCQTTLPSGDDYVLAVDPRDRRSLFVAGQGVASMWSVDQCRDMCVLVEAPVAVEREAHKRATRHVAVGQRETLVDNLNIGEYLTVVSDLTVVSQAWMPDGTLYFGSSSGKLLEVLPGSGEARVVLDAEAYGAAALTSLAFRGSHLLAADASGCIRWLDTEADMALTQTVATGEVACVASYGAAVVCAGPEGLWSLSSGIDGSPKRLTRSHAAGSVVGMAVSEAGDECFTATASGELCLWQDGRVIASATVAGTITHIAAASAPVVAVGTSDGRVRLFDGAGSRLRLMHIGEIHSAAVSGLAFTSDGGLLVSVGGGKVILTQTKAPFRPQAYLPVAEGALVRRLHAAPGEAGATEITLLLSTSGQRRADSMLLLTVPQTLTDEMMEEKFPLRLKKSSTRQRCVRAGAVDIVCAVQAKGSLFVLLGDGGIRKLAATDLVDGGVLPADAEVLDAHVASWHADIATSAGGELIVTAGADGVVTGRLTSGEGPPSELVACSFRSGGARAVGIGSGRKVFVACEDGSIVALGWKLTAEGERRLGSIIAGREGETSACPSLAATAEREELSYTPEGPAPTTELDLVIAARQQGASADSSDAQGQLRARIAALRQRVLAMIADNEKKDELERLERKEFILDLAEKKRLDDVREQALAELRDRTELEGLSHVFLRNLIKQECWDDMDPHGRTVYGFESPLEVSNFPLKRQTAKERQTLQRVVLIRKIEIAEAKSRAAAAKAGESAERPTPAAAVVEAAVAAADPSGSTAGPESGDEAKTEETATADLGTDAAGEGTETPVVAEEEEEEEEEEEAILQQPLQLFSREKKVNQMILLREEIRRKKQAFNVAFEEVRTSKVDERGKVAARNSRILAIGAELEVDVTTYTPEDHVLETPEALLTVKDEEVLVERVYTAEERAEQAEQARLEAERRVAAAMDNPHERGVQDMMHGRLEDSNDADIWIDPPRPAFLAEVDKEKWTEEQTKAAAEYEQTMAEVGELREKRRKALNAELGKLADAMDAGRDSFNRRLKQLFEQKIDTVQEVTAHELEILKLHAELEAESHLVAAERATARKVQRLRERKAQTSGIAAKARSVSASAKKEYDAEVAADRRLEVSFKQRKEFADHPMLEVLYKLYRKRPRGAKNSIEDVDVPPLDRALDMPESLDEAAWERLQRLRNEKLADEARLRVRARETHAIVQHCNTYIAADTALADEIAAAGATIDELRRQRARANLDPSILVRLKQGQVEVTHENDFDPVFAACSLMPRAVVDNLNKRTRKLGQAKVDHMQKKMELSTGVRQLEWERERLILQKEELQAKTLEVQMFKVKRHGGGAGLDPSKEVEKEKRSLAATKKAHERTVLQRKKQLTKARRELKAKTAENRELDVQLRGLSAAVGERATMHRVTEAARESDGGTEAKLRRIATRRKLLGLVKAQSEEVSLLREELERLRIKTFPTFDRPAPPFGRRAPV